MRSCCSRVRYTCLDCRHERTRSTKAKSASEARCLIRTRGWPLGSTPGPWREWHDTILTSAGRCFSKASISGALHEVWPPTMAPTLVAVQSQSKLGRESRKHTRPKCPHDGVNVLRFDAVDDVVAAAGDKVAGSHNLNFGLERLSMLLLVKYIGYPTKSLNSSTNVSYFSGTSQALTLYGVSVVACLWALVSKVQSARL
jgi:hypothetical protein